MRAAIWSQPRTASALARPRGQVAPRGLVAQQPDDRLGQLARVVLGDEATGVPDVFGQTGATRADHGRAMRHRQAGGVPGEAPRIGKHTEQRPLILADRRLEPDLIEPA